MKKFERYNLKKILLTVLWILVGAGSVILLAAAVHKKNLNRCNGIVINITGATSNFFIDKNDVQRVIRSYAGEALVGKPMDEFNLAGIETALKKEPWIRQAEIFFDNNEVLQALIEEREPIARVFTRSGNSFYLDSSKRILPLSEKFSARVPVFTGFPSDDRELTSEDLNLLKDIKEISIKIKSDSFLMAMIEQVDISTNRNFEMIPKLGNQVIVFGDASGASSKFEKLKLFYKKVIVKMGWNRYSIISLQYKDQLVAKIRGTDDVNSDSLRTKQMMEIIAANASKYAEDTSHGLIREDRKNNDISMIEESIQRDESGEGSMVGENPALPIKSNKPATPSISGPAIKNPAKPGVTLIQKPILKQTNQGKMIPAKGKPKITMPKKNEY